MKVPPKILAFFILVVFGLLWASHPDPEAMKSFTELVSRLISK